MNRHTSSSVLRPVDELLATMNAATGAVPAVRREHSRWETIPMSWMIDATGFAKLDTEDSSYHHQQFATDWCFCLLAEELRAQEADESHTLILPRRARRPSGSLRQSGLLRLLSRKPLGERPEAPSRSALTPTGSYT